MDKLIPHLFWAVMLAAVGIVVLLRAARASVHQKSNGVRPEAWLGVLLLYPIVALITWGLAEGLNHSREREKDLDESIRRLAQEHGKLHDRVRALEARLQRRP